MAVLHEYLNEITFQTKKISQKRSSFCALFKVMCFKLFQAFASKMIKEMLRFQTVKDINDAMQMKLFQT